MKEEMKRMREAYDAVAARYAEALVNELDERPIERGLLEELVRVAKGGPIADVSSADHPIGSSVHLDTWFERPVDFTAHFLDPDEVLEEARRAGFELRARLDREPLSANEYPSRRCYLLLRRESRKDPK